MVIEITSNNNYIYYTALPGTHLKKSIELSINLSLQNDKIINLEFNGYNHDIQKLSVNDCESYAQFLYKNWYTDKIEKEML